MNNQTYDMDFIRSEWSKLPEASPVRTTAPVSDQRFEKLRREKLKPARAIPTPFAQLNAAYRGNAGGKGFPYRSTNIIAGAPGFGKSLVGIQFAVAALRGGKNVAIINLEMDEDETLTRMLAALAQVPVRFLEPGDDFREDVYHRAVLAFLDLPGTLWLNPEPSLFDVGDIEQTMRVLRRKFGVELFVVDYIQLVRVKEARSRREEVETAARIINTVVKEEDAVALLLAQLKREAVDDTSSTPTQSDIQWTSSLEQDARSVLILDHSRVEEIASKGIRRLVLHTAKMRAGSYPDVVLDVSKVTLAVNEAPQGLVWDAKAGSFRYLDETPSTAA